jgi:hypothetical protein
MQHYKDLRVHPAHHVNIVKKCIKNIPGGGALFQEYQKRDELKPAKLEQGTNVEYGPADLVVKWC